MYTLDPKKAPQPGETLSCYIGRLRKDAQISQQQLATAAGIHLQSLGKLERGKTGKLNQKTKTGLAAALSIPIEYWTLDKRKLIRDFMTRINRG